MLEYLGGLASNGLAAMPMNSLAAAEPDDDRSQRAALSNAVTDVAACSIMNSLGVGTGVDGVAENISLVPVVVAGPDLLSGVKFELKMAAVAEIIVRLVLNTVVNYTKGTDVGNALGEAIKVHWAFDFLLTSDNQYSSLCLGRHLKGSRRH